MGQRTDELIDIQNIVLSLFEIIIDEVIQTAHERSDSCCLSFENLKLQTGGNETLLDGVLLKGECLEKTKENHEDVTSHMSDICYPSLANLPEMCVHSSSLSTSSNQGEGDHQPPTIREATAFYQLEQEEDNCSQRSDNCKSNSASSLHSETSHNELISNLHNEIFNLSFDNIQLSDSEADDGDGLKTPIDTVDANDFLKLSPQETDEAEDFLDSQTVLQHSKKFCQFNNTKYFPLNATIPVNYCQLVDESYEKYKMEANEEEQELLSGSSQELVIVEGDTEAFSSALNFPPTNPFRNPFLSSHCPSTMVLSSRYPNNDCEQEKSTKEINTITVVADVEPARAVSSWEEDVELQMNVTEPVKSSEGPNTGEDDDIIQTRKYWSNIGLMSEKRINPKYLGPTDVLGIESIQGMTLVEEKCLENKPEEVIWVTEPQNLDENESVNSSQIFTKDENVNYLSIADKTQKEKKKKRFITRLTSAISSIFRSKKKTSTKA